MARNFYIGSGFTNVGADSAYDVYPINFIAPTHDLKTYYTLYTSLTVEANLATYLPLIPQGSTVVIDNESPNYLESYSNGVWSVNESYMNSMIAEITAYRTARPDCTFGYDNRWPSPAVYLYDDDHLDAYLGVQEIIAPVVPPLIEVVDFLIPSISINSDETASMMAQVMRAQVNLCRKYFPAKQIIPMLRPYYIDLDLEMQAAAKAGEHDTPPAPGNYGYPYTAEQIAASNLPGAEWQIMLDMLDELYLPEFFAWSEGNRPWGLKYDWCSRTIKWKTMPRTSSGGGVNIIG